MKKLLTILWIIIISGIIFILISFFSSNKPIQDNGPEGTPEDTSDQTATLTTPEEKKTFNEYLVNGDKEFSKENYAEAILSYLEAGKINPNSSQVQGKLAEAYLINDEPDKAMDSFKSAAELNPENIAMKLGIVRAALRTKDTEMFKLNIDEAKSVLSTMDKKNPEVKYYTGIVLILYKDYKGAETAFKEIVSANPQTASQELAQNSQKFLDQFKTFSYYKEGDYLYLQVLLSKTLADTGEYYGAIPILFDVINKKNNYRDAWLVLGFCYLNTGSIPEAAHALSQAESMDPEKPETLFYLGLTYMAANNLNKAASYIEKADKNGFEPKDLIKLKLGDIYNLKGEYKKAANNYKDLIGANPSNMGVFVRTVWLYIDKLNDPQQAIVIANIALENHPEDAMSYNLKGWALTATGEYDDAHKYLAKAMELDPEMNAVTLNLGWLYEKQGLNKLAKQYYKKAYIIGNGDSIARLAAMRYNSLPTADTKPVNTVQNSKYYQVNISSP